MAILPASLLCGGVCVIENLPRIDDVLILRDIFSEMGVDVSLEGDRMTVDSSRMTNHKADFELVSCMRASYYLLGGYAGPLRSGGDRPAGGCDIGNRPIDLHIKGMEALGAKTCIEGGILRAEAPNGLTGADVYLDFASVGATINIMIAAARATGQTGLSPMPPGAPRRGRGQFPQLHGG